MKPRTDDLWTILAALLGGGLVLLAGAVMAIGETGLPAGSYAFLIPLAVYAVPLVVALAARLEPGPARPPAGDLEHLLTLKRTGSLPPARRPPPRPGGRLPGDTRRPRAVAPPAGALDRLVQRKHEWAEPPESGAADNGR
jgi:hypothetical protein